MKFRAWVIKVEELPNKSKSRLNYLRGRSFKSIFCIIRPRLEGFRGSERRNASFWRTIPLYVILMRFLSDIRQLLALIAIVYGTAACSQTSDSTESISGFRFEVVLSDRAAQGVSDLGLQTPITGRAFVVLSRDDEREPRQQVGVSGVPFWGKDVTQLMAGESVVFGTVDETVRGFPIENLSDLPPGEYFVQAFLSVYTTFQRADGHTLSMHLNSGAGQSLWRAPGNVYSTVGQFNIDSGKNQTIRLTLETVIPPIEELNEGEVLQQGNPRDTDRVKFVKIKSAVLSEFWGHPMYIGANILLPEDYDSSAQYYPVMYQQGHFPGRRAPFGFTENGEGSGRSAGFSEYWTSGNAPRMIAISIRDANPYYDTSYSVNSENVGPYGDAITDELIPTLEKEFRIIPSRWARFVSGGSTGGWESLAMQIFYPDFFGGAWGSCPDPVDFNYYQIVNIYEDENAYFTGDEWHQIERPNARRFDGNIRSTVRQENHLELATGPNSRSGGQWAIWEAVFGPVGDNGYPKPIWDPVTGQIDKETADFWRSNYDLHEHLRSNWETIGPKLDGMLNIAVGDMDTYYLDNAVYLMDEFLNTATGPRIEVSVQYGRRKPHCWGGYSPNNPGEDMTTVEFVQIVADHFGRNAPTGADLGWMKP